MKEFPIAAQQGSVRLTDEAAGQLATGAYVISPVMGLELPSSPKEAEAWNQHTAASKVVAFSILAIKKG